MAHGREGEQKPIEIRHLVVRQQAQQTIKNLVDAVVELVTNCDDSYRRLEDEGAPTSGRIDISVKRRKGGEWEFLRVSDNAEGMDLDRMLNIVHYGEQASGFQEGRGVRGLFGRGLKEAAIGLGEGIVRSAKEKEESEVKIWWDERTQQVMRGVLKDSRTTTEQNGTEVTILSKTTEVRCPLFDKLCEQFSNHYALRDINSSKRRQVYLTLQNVGGGRGRGSASSRQIRRLRYKLPDGMEVERKSLDIEGIGRVNIEIYEAEQKLDFASFDPFSRAGLLVKTEGATLDNRLFGFDNDESAQYFFGIVYCPGIARKVRGGDFGLVDPARSGLQWKHPSCAELHKRVQEVLTPHVERKKKELASGDRSRPSEHQRRKIQVLCNLLNSFAKKELDVLPEEDGEGIERGDEITALTVKPEVGNARPKKVRTFSVYLPKVLAQSPGACAYVELLDTRGRVRILDSPVPLRPHSKYPALLAGRFGVVGQDEGDEAYIVARFGTSEDIAEFHVRPPGNRKQGDTPLKRRKGGMFERIDYDNSTSDPFQRVAYRDGVMTVYLKFPPTSRYLGTGGKGWDQPQGSLLLAELVAEAFSMVIVRKQLESGKIHKPPAGDIDVFNKAVNDVMKKYLHPIHKSLVV